MPFVYNIVIPNNLRLRLLLENDDKSYGATDVLTLCQTLHCPMVLDIHHHACHNKGEKLADIWGKTVNTWGNNIPKIHVSSPKSKEEKRSHIEY